MIVDIELLKDDQIYERIMRQDIPSAIHSVLIVTALAKQTTVETDEGDYVPFMKLIENLIRRRVNMCLLLAGKPSRPLMQSLRSFPDALKGMAIRLCVRNHMKIILIDGKKLYLGSANLTGAGMGRKDPNNRNFEFGFFTGDPFLIKIIAGIVQNIWNGKHCETCQTKSFCRLENDRFNSELKKTSEKMR